MRLTRTDAAAFTGATLRQLTYWTFKGIVQQGADQRYDSRAIERILLIKQGLDAGLGLRKAARAADRYQAQLPDEATGQTIISSTEIVDTLRRARREVQLALDYLTARGGGETPNAAPEPTDRQDSPRTS